MLLKFCVSTEPLVIFFFLNVLKKKELNCRVDYNLLIVVVVGSGYDVVGPV